MEVAPQIHRIQVPFGERYVCLYLLNGEEHALLIDSGLDSTPREHLQPYLDEIGVPARKIRYVLTSHADFDHTAGNGSLQALAPDALFLCHRLDQTMVESVERLIGDRYGEFAADHGIDETDRSKAFIRSVSRHVPVDIALSGGEKIRLGANWEVEVLHTPGHSRGHVSVYDARSRSLIIADATLYNAVLRADGKPAFPPTYRYVDTYVATMQRIAGMAADRLLTSHYPIYSGDAIAEFLAESRAYVDRIDAALQKSLQEAAAPLTMRELIDQLGSSLGEWPAAAHVYLANPFQGHLERMVAHRLVQTGRRDGLLTYRWQQD